MALERAKFINNKIGKFITVQFNPSSLSIVTNAMVSEKKTQQMQSDNSILNIGGIESRKLSLSLVFDSYEEESNGLSSLMKTNLKAGKDVKAMIDNFEFFMDSLSEITFAWGSIMFTGYINNISTKYEMFSPQGLPVRASVDISMQESKFQRQAFQDVALEVKDLGESDSEESMMKKVISMLSGV